MMLTFQPWQFLFAVFCGWVHQRQTEIIEFQNDQITTLMRALGKKRLLLTDNQRRLLAVKGKAIGRKALLRLTTIVTPDTILGWHRKLVAVKWDYSQKRKSVGRPRTPQVIVDLVLRFAQENPDWGYDRIVGVLARILGSLVSVYFATVLAVLLVGGHRARSLFTSSHGLRRLQQSAFV